MISDIDEETIRQIVRDEIKKHEKAQRAQVDQWQREWMERDCPMPVTKDAA